MTKSKNDILIKLLESMLSATNTQQGCAATLAEELRCFLADIISTGAEMIDEDLRERWILINSFMGDAGQSQHLIDQKFELVGDLFKFPMEKTHGA